ncbi:hypothetical protein CsatB_013184 [Cannabis sativa]|uniref:Methyltransferase-like protein 13 n=2 Tax=Cannabis sativa TaxID=3483 RepID=A0A7J6GYZ6_CANSA|nr:uncharacterized protein LOC115708086 [Cannabis sativa]XP_030492132.2 uncharacterized protein LOC115708086 [Cannabis sativa]KAF4387590.1 hypothetical protein G4B88_003917 [Cannabis sativa]
MAVDKTTFEAIVPSRFISLSFPTPNPNPNHSSPLLRIAVLDSPTLTLDPPLVAAMFVPQHRESDWIFSTESGHLHLLHSSPGISRLILLGNSPEKDHPSSTIYSKNNNNNNSMSMSMEVSFKPLLLALSPKSCFKHGNPHIPILSYEDGVICGMVLERFVGSIVGEMLVEDVEIEVENGAGNREFRRRLRFKRMPNLIQSEVRIFPKEGIDFNSIEIGEVEFSPDNNVLLQPYLSPMVASLSLIGKHIQDRIFSGFRPKALCLGVGGGALLSFLKTQLGFEVLGVEEDEQVLSVARKFFGLQYCPLLKIFVGDAMEFLEKISHPSGECNASSIDAEFDVIMVDLDSSDARSGVYAPPLEFGEKHVLMAAKSILSKNGILALNVIPQSNAFYETTKHEFQQVFSELYEIDVRNGENFVLIATTSPVMSSSTDTKNLFLSKLRNVISGAFMDSIKKI